MHEDPHSCDSKPGEPSAGSGPQESNLTEEDAQEARAPASIPAADGRSGRLGNGIKIIRGYLDHLGGEPGVYRMLSADGEALYVGKAHNLKKRVATYTRPERLPIRLQRMVAETTTMEFVTTRSEVEALLLENNLIKQLAPRYNVLLRDDKTFPDILIRGDHPFPQIVKHRGARKQPGDFFGPFASAGAVNRTLNVLQRAFLLRNCSDGVFRNRSRPCLQYQIKRCSAPCVGYIDETDYAASVGLAKDFLSGRSNAARDTLVTEMQTASEALEFERAAQLRDRVKALALVLSQQDINVEGVSDADIVALASQGGQTCIQVFFYRGGRNNGNRAYFPSHDRQIDAADVMAAFLGQFYENRPPPKEVLCNQVPAEPELLAEALSVRAERKVTLAVPQRGGRRTVVDHAANNARDALGRRLAEGASQRRLLDGLAELVGLDDPIERVEVYDNSHTGGTRAVGGMVVAGAEGLNKNQYRKFNIKTAIEGGEASAGDDYAMTREVFERRFGRALKEDPERQSGTWPDLVIVDGGKGQLSSALEVLEELGLKDTVPIMAVAKGPERNAGRERIHLPGKEQIMLPPRDPVLYFIQRLRDEAHRFAIGSHRQRRAKDQTKSPLDEVPGVGARRKKALLLHFGSAKAVARAGARDLEHVDGISAAMAQRIFQFFHPD